MAQGSMGRSTCCIDHSLVLGFIGSAPSGTAGQRSDRGPSHAEVISVNSPHGPPSTARETRQRDAPAAHRDSISLPPTLRGSNSNRDRKKRRKKLAGKCDIGTLDGLGVGGGGKKSSRGLGALAQESIVAWQQLSTSDKTK